jgi:hypothetical protein
MAVLRVIGAGLSALWSGLAWLWAHGVYEPLRWLAVVLVWGALRLLGRGTGRVARWFYSVVLAPSGRLLAAIGTAVGVALIYVVAVLLVMPAIGLWRYVLRPPLLGLAWLASIVVEGLAWCGRRLATGVRAVWGVVAGALVWAWRMLGRLLTWIIGILLVIPALAVYRCLLRPIGLAIAFAWRLAGRGLRWLWRNLVVAPAHAITKAMLVPAGRALRAVWRVSVRDPARWVRRSVLAPLRQTVRDVRMQFHRAFRGGQA